MSFFQDLKKSAFYLAKRSGNKHGYLPNPVPGIGQNFQLVEVAGRFINRKNALSSRTKAKEHDLTAPLLTLQDGRAFVALFAFHTIC